jgi:CDP-glucose 4,6-dehydratase
MIDRNLWKGRRVFVTGHTGFKGAWLVVWLRSMGAEVFGLALNPPTTPSMFNEARLDKHLRHTIGDVRDFSVVLNCLQYASPEVVFHLAAQSLVPSAYASPVDTYSTNVMGSVNLFEACRSVDSVKMIINVTTDKCYENNEWCWGYRESDPLGGYDPYSASKACADIIGSSFCRSFLSESGVKLHSVRAGNVIGGGDWSHHRLIPDAIRAFLEGRPVKVKNPGAVRPWQHVLESLSAYILVAQQCLVTPNASNFVESWNVGPSSDSNRPVSWLISKIADAWGGGASWEIDEGQYPHEANLLKLSNEKIGTALGWEPTWGLEKALVKTVDWYKKVSDKGSAYDSTLADIADFERDAKHYFRGEPELG